MKYSIEDKLDQNHLEGQLELQISQTEMLLLQSTMIMEIKLKI